MRTAGRKPGAAYPHGGTAMNLDDEETALVLLALKFTYKQAELAELRASSDLISGRCSDYVAARLAPLIERVEQRQKDDAAERAEP